MSDDPLFELDTIAPWERQQGETAVAFRAFVAYRDMGGRRSLRRLADEISGTGSGPAADRQRSRRKSQPGQLGKWSTENGWAERAAAWDAQLEADRAAVAREELREAARREARLSRSYIELAQTVVDSTDPKRVTLPHAIQLGRVGIWGERKALGMDVDRPDDDLDDGIELDETPEQAALLDEYARLRNLARTGEASAAPDEPCGADERADAA